MSSTLDYINRQVDLLAYAGAQPTGTVILEQTLAREGESGEICAGVQKLAQRFLLKMLTERGTKLYRPRDGCDFMTKARLGHMRTSIDVFAAFSAALLDIRDQLLTEELETDPDDERFDSAIAEAVSATPGSVALTIRLNSRAGSSRAIILPIPITVGH